MESIHQKVKGGTWYISCRPKGKIKHRSLGTTHDRKVLELKREIEYLIEEHGIVEITISEQLKLELKN